MSELSHVDARGAARMVDVSEKDATSRTARAAGLITMATETLNAIRDNSLKKGDVLAVARTAGIMAAKRTADLVPLCHQLPLTAVEVAFELRSDPPAVQVEATVRTIARTGVEMEALVAAGIALITIYDMTKGVDRSMTIADLRVLEKRGGRSG
ncbi:MAG TPA: cyclic pyranopterin monophosphate synthase MoaC [Gemmatimonadaceae bacterium]|nr:cyclic pyranopterin monophosphate synthase MoaC [Gemmatimonadaceae bacterium]